MTMGSVEVVRPKLDERTYSILVQRYKEMFSSGEGSGSGPEAPYELDGHITEIDTGLIDTDYMNANFTKWLKALGGGDPGPVGIVAERSCISRSLRSAKRNNGMPNCYA